MKTIFILGGFLSKRRDAKYASDQLSYLRILAGYYLYKKISEKDKVELIVSGGKGIYRGIPGIPPVATVMKRELITLGIRPKEININKIDFTYPELFWLKKHIAGKKAFIVSNTYHLPRIRTMIDLLPKLAELKTRATPISAEKIVSKFNKKMRLRVVSLTKNKKMKKLIAAEKKGVIDLKSGNYKFKK